MGGLPTTSVKKMAQLKVAINGFGRIGRLVGRAFKEMNGKVDLVAVNDLSSPPETLAHLFSYDSVHGRYGGDVEVDGDEIIIDGDRIRVLSEPDPARLPWREMEIDYVIESTGHFANREKLALHLEAGAKRVILSAPSKGPIDGTFVRGINSHEYDPERHRLVSNASCTTNCLAPMLKVLHDNFGVENGMMTTVHAYTNDQRLLDGPHNDLRRARAAAVSMIPSTTGAAKAIGLVMPELAGRIDGMSIRVPIPNGSLTDLTVRLSRNVTDDEVADAYRSAENGPLKGILRAEPRPLVGADFNHDPHSVTIDLPSIMVVDGSLVKVLGWYDNEWGYAKRTAELAIEMWDKEPGVAAGSQAAETQAGAVRS
jgi:glyceraldehyde 3-phosphate dehydrogenase